VSNLGLIEDQKCMDPMKIMARITSVRSRQNLSGLDISSNPSKVAAFNRT
jgi:hypothetical protein